MEADPYQSINSQLRQVRRKLDELAHYRAVGGLTKPEQAEYQSLCEQERDLLRQLVR
jgi:hypothetical protein